ncbi:peptidoglycan-binding protein [Altibacter sp. HG106]|uniref:peptidoglycan-binding protein n=1 Tax=Altibacter sp. HG106 TaxID=3023937 RepID=UPI002350FEB2|nr:peptidoglycan-binding protein [Altibacter sp. HG106]MDC7995423.1 peptidoglycan-binding protein [Altibacter sp. HG106]
MRKNAYLKELTISGTQRRDGDDNTRKDVMKIQSWLSLNAIANPSSGTATAIDGAFGPATERAVKNYQEQVGRSPSGIVSNQLFSMLCAPMKTAFETPLEGDSFREHVVAAAELHLKSTAYELQIKGASNSGPWVRAYMDGHEGSPWYWCMGFAQTIIDQAASANGKNFKTLFPLTYSCDVVGMKGIEKGLLSRYQTVRTTPDLIQPGDLFLLQKSTWDWTHTGVVIDVNQDVIETIEGNTNMAGSRNGIAVMKRTRNFMQSKLDFFSVAPLNSDTTE